MKEDENELALGLWERLLASCIKIPVRDNFYLSWWLRGIRGFDPEKDPTMAPPFLTKEGFTKLKVSRSKSIPCNHDIVKIKLSSSCFVVVCYRDLWTELKCLHVLLKTIL